MTRATFPPQLLPTWRRAVLKIGSSLLAEPGAGLHDRHARHLAAFIDNVRAAGREIVLVSSGAVAAGRGRIGAEGDGLVQRQALAALGQASLIGFWQSLLPMPAAQVLLSHDDLRDRRRWLNARSTLRELLRLGALPVINENDTVAVDELKLGDNDNLAAAVVSLIEADLLLIATDIDGLYSGYPERDADALPVPRIASITPQIMAMAGGSGSAAGTGGMQTKLQAAAKAASAGAMTALFNGRDAEVLKALSEGELRGTLVDAASGRLAARKQWLNHAPVGGRLWIDAGAARALIGKRASLLPGGVGVVEGEFRRGDVLDVLADNGEIIARGLAQYATADLRRIAGAHSREIEARLGFRYGEAVIHRDDLILLQTENAA